MQSHVLTIASFLLLGVFPWVARVNAQSSESRANAAAGKTPTTGSGTAKEGMPTDDQPKWADGRTSSMRDGLDIQGPILLLYAPAVKDEIGLTEKQEAMIQHVREARRESLRDGVKAALFVRAEKGEEAYLAARRESWQKQSDLESVEIRKILTNAQSKRLLEIAIQVEGPMSIAWPEVQSQLNMSPSQRVGAELVKNRFLEVRKQHFAALSQLFDSYHESKRKDPDEKSEKVFVHKTETALDRAQKAYDASRSAAELEMLRILTARQKAKLRELRGEPYDDVSDLVRLGGGKWRPDEEKKYREERGKR